MKELITQGLDILQTEEVLYLYTEEIIFFISLYKVIRTGKLQILTNTSLDESPTISPNGKVIIYATKDQEQGILAGISIDGKTRFILPTNSGEVREPKLVSFIESQQAK